MRKKVIIDTDPGIDDAMAIMLALKSKKFDILAFTTVCGNTTIKNTTRNAQYILRELGVINIPVYSGASKPLKRKLIPAFVHGQSGLVGITPNNKPLLTNNAVDKIIELAKKNPRKITLITLGPLTNLAQAIQKDPKAVKMLSEVVMMGGAIRTAGNMNRVAEFNMFVDPEAADIVFKFPIKKTLVPLDVCNTIALPLSDFAKIKDKKINTLLLEMVKPYIENLQKEGYKNAIMYDPVTIYSLLYPEKLTTEFLDITIETKGNETRGMTVADLRPQKQKIINMNVVTSLKLKDFRKNFLEILNQGEKV
ncbi:MAG: nucleoside hydrolase [Candidatus Levybacteria bacterium]|nr:nucleoside hydrolase [Candidatus Levybacteria bacterium]